MLAETLESRKLLTTITWSAGPALPAPRTDAVAIVTSDSAIRLLGGDAGAATDAPVLASDASNWSLGIGIATQPNDLGAVRSGGSVVLFGGAGNDEGSSEVLNDDYRQGDSQDLAQMNEIRYDHGFAADASGRAYAIGGIGVLADREIWSSVERYSPVGDAWTAIAPLPQPLHGLSATGDSNGHVSVFDGSTTVDDSGIQSAAYCYDIATDTWSSIGPMPVGTRDSALAIDTDGKIYVTGGMSSTGATDDVWIVDNLTDSVYRYNGGATRVSGNAVADAVFMLDPTNTNPLGIADPAVAGEVQTAASQLSAVIKANVPGDVNGDGYLSARNALMIINHLGSDRTDLFASTLDQGTVWDVNRDGRISQLDALAVINRLSRTPELRSSKLVDVALDQITRHDGRDLEAGLPDEIITAMARLR